MLRFAERKFREQIQVAWRDFNMTALPVPFDSGWAEQVATTREHRWGPARVPLLEVPHRID
jgi:hypothetical protein